jgi:flagellar biosynthesis protein FliP
MLVVFKTNLQAKRQTSISRFLSADKQRKPQHTAAIKINLVVYSFYRLVIKACKQIVLILFIAFCTSYM